mmetsp:Transcript_7628/g.20668  ORF Transcript_7628/g.20668 Transcript_7628/m.20668 type:complete len:542 (-) Transcript_7628:601-2226(-)|eukprot:CAMPEP_0198119568 /NCGR_PEP_ID=MMETSP1442-20131203/26109_1 /TAXON_ID= /ORGANISM="Craspedostauros australis, Strain CCMP3328" /LENGTH=541 /DNA_ID=CAMNT_0043778073 /DNA_START=124 /DNA_END=1749 /DNA_ORIENTATION=-
MTDFTTIRNLNDYECILAPMTCNAGVSFSMPDAAGDAGKAAITQAWKYTVARYECLQVRLKARDDDASQGVLGQRFTIEKSSSVEDAIEIAFHEKVPVEAKSGSTSGDAAISLLQHLQLHGTTKVEWTKSSYNLEFYQCNVDKDDDKATVTSPGVVAYRMILCLCHSVSDGPGTLSVVRYFLSQLSSCIKVEGGSGASSSDACLRCIDLQAHILGADYGSSVGKDDAAPKDGYFPYLEITKAALGKSDLTFEDGTKILRQEPRQGLPKPDEGSNSGAIEALSIELSEAETAKLRENCKAKGATVQGALNVAFGLVRLALLDHAVPCKIPFQIPMNCRKLTTVAAAPPPADSNSDKKEAKSHHLDDTCLCGSAGLWQLLDVGSTDKILSDLANKSSGMMRKAADDGQPKEWLRRLMNNPAAMPPYALMMSSIGVAPVKGEYDNGLSVKDLIFFGGAKRPPAPSGAQATMVHVQTFGGRLHLTFNYLGVNKIFAEKTVKGLQFLLKMIAGQDTDSDNNAAATDSIDLTVAEVLDKLSSVIKME